MWIKETKSLQTTIQSLYNIVWVQCSKLMCNKVRAVKDFRDIENKGDVTRLLLEIRGVSHQLEANMSVYNSLDEAKKKFYAYKQGDDNSNAKHLQNFKSIVDVIEHFGGDIFQDKALKEHERSKYGEPIDEQDIEEHERFLEKTVRNKMMAVAFIKRANTKRYENLMMQIWDQFAFGQDVYPKNLTAAYELLENHSQSRLY
jgi:hypothetical protein